MSARDPGTDDAFAPKFAAEAFKNNPQCQVFIYGNWTDADRFDQPPFGNTESHIENVGAAVDKAFPDAPKTRMIPCSMVMRELGRLADRGELPGVPSHYALYADGIHPSHIASYAFNVLVLAILYNESPLDYPLAAYHLSPDTAATIRRVVWDVMQTYPPDGMTPKLIIAYRSLDYAVTGLPYRVELKALHAGGACRWSIAVGALPPGISLSPDGLITGQSARVGNYPVTIRVSAGATSVDRALVLHVQDNLPLSIPDQPLNTVRMDQYTVARITTQGGVGYMTYSVSAGRLPWGVKLLPSGTLFGTPGEEGDFTFTVKAEDSYPTGAHAAEKQFTWHVTPARPDTLPVKYVLTQDQRLDNWKTVPEDANIKVDGKLDEPFWRLDQPIARKVTGNPVKTASFSAVWTAQCRLKTANGDKKDWYLAGGDLVISIKVLDGAKGKTPKDGVHLFLDGNHDQTTIYSGDDAHFFISRDSKGDWAQSLSSKPNWMCRPKVQEIEGGYTMEILVVGFCIPGDTPGENIFFPFGEHAVYGLDIAVDEGEEGAVAQQVWHGDANNATDTSHFGTILLVAQPAVAP